MVIRGLLAAASKRGGGERCRQLVLPSAPNTVAMSRDPSDSASRAVRAPWIPTRRSVLWLFTEPSSYLLIVAAVLTLVAKIVAVQKIAPANAGPLFFSAFHVVDICLFLGLAALFAAAESVLPKLRWITIPLSALILVFVAINTPLLILTGTQLHPDTIAMGISRAQVTFGVLGDAVGGWAILLPLGLAFIVCVPLVLRRWLKKRTTTGARVRDRQRAVVALLGVGAAALLLGASPRMTTIATQELQNNALIDSYRYVVTYGYQHEWRTGDAADPGGELRPFIPETLVSDAQIEKLRADERPNVLFIVLESTRFDYLQNPDDQGSLAETPHLLALAKRGTWAKSAYTAFPHTTKSLFSILCGRLPAMQPAFFLTSATPFPQCLPSVLRQAGYNTYFSQSAVGAFERRPVLAHHAGYETFKAWEEIGGEKLGYLASDDLSLVAPFENWLTTVDEREPFMATVLTSATHHPYRLTRREKRKLKKAGIDPKSLSEAERYAKLIQVEDQLVGRLLAILEDRDLLDNTLVVVVGDHGEGFGDKGVRQHDNNFYQEGLHVPLIVAGPGVPQKVVERTVSLTDVTPTIFDLLNVHWTRPNEWEFGFSLLGPAPPDREVYFMCYYNNECAGFIEGDTKVVVQFAKRRAFYFDLLNDPSESRPLRLTPQLRARLDEALGGMGERRFDPDRMQKGDTPVAGEWKCPADKPCRHPKTPRGGLFRDKGR